jgi:glycosyltransferase involved in cell wall biosynthesis
MRVLFISRPTIFSTPGGDTIQLIKTAEQLKKLGVSVTIRENDEPIEHFDFDLIHFFNIVRPDDILPFIKLKPFVVSTIFVDYSEYEKKSRTGILGIAFKFLPKQFIEYFKSIARSAINGQKIKSWYFLFNGQKKSIKKIADNASMLLPNSENEFERFSNYLNKKYAYKAIVNAVDQEIFNYDRVQSNVKYKDYIICVGRIEGLKNQLNLIKAIKTTNLNLLLVGKPAPNHKKYYQLCKYEAKGYDNIQFLDHLSHYELAQIYKSAKVHVLPSWFETTGLSSLEAGVMNCNLVITDKGDQKEYFKDMAFYCKPDDIDSIRNAVLQAYNEPVNNRLRNYILTNYTWNITAAQTFDAYISVLNYKV